MCAPASMILTKDSVLWSKTTDSHEEIIREFGIRDAVGGVPQIVRVEITPPHGNFEAPAKDWTYKLDQDHVPAWYEAEEGERRTREALPAWIAEKIVLRSETIVSLSAGIKLAVYGQVGTVGGNGQVGTVRGGTIQLFAAVSLASALKARKGTTAVLIDRSGKTPVCYVGPQKAKQATKRAKKGGVK